MRRLFLLRHAKTETAESGKDDRTRALLERGKRDAALIGAYMTTHAFIPDRVVISPARRVQETWKHMSAALKPAPGATTTDRIYEASPHDIFALIVDTPPTAQSLMIVGHNPSLHEVAMMLVASGDIDARERLNEKLPTTGLIIIDFALDEWSKVHPQSGRLERFITPKSIDTATR